MALHSNLKTTQALEMLSNAISIDRKNPLARFQKAQVLIALEQYEEALVELRTLVEVAPKEGSVYFVLGKVYKNPNPNPDPIPNPNPDPNPNPT